MTATLTLHAGDPAQALDAAVTGEFLQSQARWLAHALDNADSPVVVRTVLDMHERSHGLWLALIADLQVSAPGAADEVQGLYSFHGRIVGSLERGLEGWLGWGLRRRVRSLLARRLDQLTDEAVYAIQSLAAEAESA